MSRPGRVDWACTAGRVTRGGPLFHPVLSRSLTRGLVGRARRLSETNLRGTGGRPRSAGYEQGRQLLGAADEAVAADLESSRAASRTYLAARAFSIAAVTLGESGSSPDSKRASSLPSRPMRNLLKFHLTSPGNAESLPVKAA